MTVKKKGGIDKVKICQYILWKKCLSFNDYEWESKQEATQKTMRRGERKTLRPRKLMIERSTISSGKK